MKKGTLIAVFFLLLTFLGKSQNPLDKRISINATDKLLETVLFQIEDDAHIKLFYGSNIIPEKKVTIRMKRQKLRIILNHLFEKTQLKYKVIGQQVVLYKTDVPIRQKRFTISGFVEDLTTGERLNWANVFDRWSQKGTITNEYGFFSLTLPEGEVELSFSFLGYAPEVRIFTLSSNTSLKVFLSPSLVLPQVVVISSDSTNEAIPPAINPTRVAIGDIERLPSLAGEPDPMRVLALLPGIQTGTDGIGGLHIRGSNVGHNLIMIDDVPVYNISHAAGLFSIFNTSAIKSINLLKGGIPARFGGRLSSVLDVRTREGNKKKLKGRADIGLLSNRVTLEGPIKKDRSSFLISGRHSFLNWYLNPLSRKSKADRGEIGETNYKFYDFNAKLNFTLSDTDNLYFSFYQGNDEFSNDGRFVDTFQLRNSDSGNLYLLNRHQQFKEKWGWGNTIAALRWNHLYNEKLFSNTIITFSDLSVNNSYLTLDSLTQLKSNVVEDLRKTAGRYESGITDLGIRMDFQYLPNPVQTIRFGISGTHHHFTPGAQTAIDGLGIQGEISNSTIKSLEFGAYLEDQIEFAPNFILNFGIHVSALNVEGTSYASVQPRISANYAITDHFSLWGSYNVMTQFLHLLTTSNLGLPSDLWVPSTSNVAPERSYQFSTGIGWNMKGNYDLIVEGYYKRMDNLLNYSEGALTLTNWEENVTSGNGNAYGVEFMIRKNRGKTRGWLSYNLSKSDRQFDNINLGRRYDYRYDRRHQLSLALIHKVARWLEFTGSWTFSTGYAFSFPFDEIVYVNPNDPNNTIVLPNYEAKNNARMPSYHRMDIGANLYFDTEVNRKMQHTLNIGAYNIYDRRNPLYVNLRRTLDNNENYELREKKELIDVWLLPFLPSLNYTVKF